MRVALAISCFISCPEILTIFWVLIFLIYPEVVRWGRVISGSKSINIRAQCADKMASGEAKSVFSFMEENALSWDKNTLEV